MTEYEIQKAVIKHIKAKHPYALYTATQGGVMKTVQAAAKMRAAGAVRGVPDLLIFSNNGEYNGLALELKTEKGKPTPEQIKFLEGLIDCGWFAAVTYGYEMTCQFIDQYFEGE